LSASKKERVADKWGAIGKRGRYDKANRLQELPAMLPHNEELN